MAFTAPATKLITSSGGAPACLHGAAVSPVTTVLQVQIYPASAEMRSLTVLAGNDGVEFLRDEQLGE